MVEVMLEGVSKSFNDVIAVKSVSAEIRDREFFAILGQTGSGKTTLLRMIVGLEKPDKGAILLDKMPREKIPVGSGEVQMVFQDFALWPHMKVFDNLTYPLRVRRLKEKEILKRVEEVVNMVGIPSALLRRMPQQLSEGQKQMVAIARALVSKPRLLLLDEPFAHLDPITKLKIRGELLKMQAQLAMTIVLVTHQLSDAVSLADRLAVMLDGHFVQVASPEELMQDPANEYVSAYVRSYALLPKRK